MSKEDFLKVWKDTSRENILNQFYYEHKTLREQYNNWNELKSWGEKRVENANKYLKDPNENWDEDTRGYVLARKFQLEEMLKQMQELESSNENNT